MPLATGTRLEHYEILGPLGAGGMGEVYRARDAKLRREVAIKILPPQFASDPARLVRFEREAHVLAALNHPHIAAIYGLEHAEPGDIRFLVLELVEGPTLADKLAAGRIEFPEAIRIASQIAEALEAAHEKGVIHRDLKPANVKLTAGGNVKVLDFGLAKALDDPEPTPSNAPETATLTMQETRAGTVVGTAAYMSPEQAEGKPTDKRSDVWSFGVLLYEMLSGQRCFEGKTVSHVLVHVLEQEPDWSKLPGAVPQGVRDVLARCLRKDPAQRLRDIGDVRLLLQELAAHPSPPQAAKSPAVSSHRGMWAAAAAAVLLLALGAWAYLYFRPKASPPPVSRFEIAAPPQASAQWASVVSVSPDGSRLLFHGSSDGGDRLWMRRLDSLESRPVDGTDRADGLPIWSPDSRFFVFAAGGKLKKIEVAGGPAQVLGDSAASILGGFFTSDGRIIFSGLGPRGPALLEINTSGGVVSKAPVASNDEPSLLPSPLPDGRHFLYTRAGAALLDATYLGSLDAKSAKKLLPGAAGIYAPSPDPNQGYVLFVRRATQTDASGTLMAQPFDPRKLEFTGDPIPIAEKVNIIGFSASSTGVLAYRADAVGPPGEQLSWYDRTGKLLSTTGDPGTYQRMSFSPDGTRVVAERLNPQGKNGNLWIFDLKKNVSTQFTSNDGMDDYPVWSPDGREIAFGSMRGGKSGIYVKPSDGSAEEQLLFASDQFPVLGDWSSDGRSLTYHVGPTRTRAFVLPVEGGKGTPLKTGTPYELVRSTGEVRGVRFSRDMHWIAYLSNETGQYEIYVRAFDANAPNGTPPGAGTYKISTNGGTTPRWNENGKELFYRAAGGAFMSVSYTTRPGVFEKGTVTTLFKFPGTPDPITMMDISPDGQRFLRAVPLAANSATPYTVVLNWTANLKH